LGFVPFDREVSVIAVRMPGFGHELKETFPMLSMAPGKPTAGSPSMSAWMSSESTYIIDLAPGELRATYLASSTAAFGVASFIGSNLGGYIIDTYFNGIAGLNNGLFLSSALRILFGLAYLTAFESKKPETP